MMKPVAALPLLLALAGMPLQVLATPFTNGIFDPDFAGWQGVLFDYGSSSDVPVAPNASDYFERLGGGLAKVQLLAAQTNIGIAELYQTFEITDPARPLHIQFSWDWVASDPEVDTFVMELRDAQDTEYNFVDSLFGTPPGLVRNKVTVFAERPGRQG
jgi:hypothetical protein